MRPNVSVIVPVFNKAHFISDALASIRRQTLPPEQIIVVDDASTDDTANVAERELRSSDVVIRRKVNGGAGAARSDALAHVTGDVVAFLDADDIWLPWHLEQLMPLLDGDVRVVSGSPAPEPSAGSPQRLRSDAKFDGIEMLHLNHVAQSGALLRRSTLAEIGGYHPHLRYAEDYELWCRLSSRASTTLVCGVPSFWYRRHEQQTSLKNGRAMIQSAWGSRTTLVKRLMSEGAPADRCQRALQVALDNDLLTAWSLRDKRIYSDLVMFSDALPLQLSFGQWEQRFGWQWPLTKTVLRLSDALRRR